MTMTANAPANAPASSGSGGSTTIVRRAFEPLESVGSASGLKALLDTQRLSIADALPRHVTPERIIKTLLVAANRTPDLLQCTQASILETINRAAELGLDLSGTLGEAYPVPFNNNIGTRDNPKWVKQCQLIIGYRGYAKLARQTGEIKRIEANVVCKNDKFTMRKGSNAACEFELCLEDRGAIVGAFAYVQFNDGGEQFDFMPAGDIEKVRARSKSGNDRQGNAIGAWKTDWPEMAKKTVFRRVAKWLPLSTEKFVKAMEYDSGGDEDLTHVIEAQTRRGMAGLQDKVTRRPLSEGMTLDTNPEANLPPAPASDEDAAHLRDVVDGGSAEPEVQPDVGHTNVTPEQEADAGAEATAHWEDPAWAEKRCADTATDLGIKISDFKGGLFKYHASFNFDAARKLSPEQWRALFEAIAGGRFDYKAGKIG